MEAVGLITEQGLHAADGLWNGDHKKAPAPSRSAAETLGGPPTRRNLNP
jgi:hypothetical protein